MLQVKNVIQRAMNGVKEKLFVTFVKDSKKDFI